MTDEPRYYCLLCRVCNEHDADEGLSPMIMPFPSMEERGRWAGDHTRGTGHEDWIVWEEQS